MEQGWLNQASALVNEAERARSDEEPQFSIGRLINFISYP
jgi:hypothetical protein